MIETERKYTVVQAARELKVSREMVWKAVRRGWLHVSPADVLVAEHRTFRLIRRSAIDDYLRRQARRRKRAAP